MRTTKRRLLLFVIAAAFFSCVIFLFPSPAAAALFVIADPEFSGLVDDTTYAITSPAINGKISKTKLTNGNLYFSFRVIGAQKAIDHLNSFGSLEVRVTVYAGWSKLGSFEIGIDQNNWRKNGKALTDEFKQNGIFNWRTYMQTQQVNYSSITIKISDSNSDYVAPLDNDGAAYEATVDITP